jgi:hypothetical protein
LYLFVQYFLIFPALMEISTLLETDLNKDALAAVVAMTESGINPETIISMVHQFF